MRAGMRVVTLEEHFTTQDFPTGEGLVFTPDFAERVGRRIGDFEQFRLPEMDAAGIDVQVLSLTTPGVQAETDPAAAVVKAERCNDLVVKIVRTHPERFAAFAALPTQDPRAAVAELRRTVLEHGFKGALVNGHTGGRYLDDPGFEPLWESLEELRVPLYLHPTFSPVPPAPLDGYPALSGPVWGWGVETASHALRLVASGLFDRHPGATVILGHMGEGLPFTLDRIDDRWAILRHPRPLHNPPSYYLRNNFYVTSAGVESAVPLDATIAALGADRVLFSVDYPYQSAATAADFLERWEAPADVRRAVAGENADRLLALRQLRS